MKQKKGLGIKFHSGKPVEHACCAGYANAGVAMVMVMIVSAVVMVFCLTLLLVTYTLFSQNVRQMSSLQCKLLAQSVAESLAQEFENPDSELSKYLSAQIQNNTWVAQNVSAEAGAQGNEESAGENAVSELELLLDAGGKTDDYRVSVTLTYSLNVADDDGKDDGDDEDDQDQELSGGGGAGDNGGAKQTQGQSQSLSQETESGEPNSGEASGEGNANETGNGAGNGSYAIEAVICCMRGDGTDRDTQSYTIETEYPAVTLQ